jgi:membrane-bound lytic murein transglycosylase B
MRLRLPSSWSYPRQFAAHCGVALLLCLWLPGISAAQSLTAYAPYHERSDVREYIDALIDDHGFNRGWLERNFAQARYSEDAERLTTPALQPPSARNWAQYRTRNVDDKRIKNGVDFWRAQHKWLARAHQRWGVPPEIIVAILGIETQFGRTTGTFRTLDVLLTLSFDYTRRASFYRDELTQFLLLMREQRLDPLAQHGSFAGAMGLPQFMPGSVRRHAVDFDRDGRIDLSRSTADAIGSIANFLATHGWQPQAPVQFSARADATGQAALGAGIEAIHRWQDVAALGVMIDGDLDGDTRVLLADLPYDTPEGLAALLGYNRSYFYAAAVADLAEAIRARAESLRAVRVGGKME